MSLRGEENLEGPLLRKVPFSRSTEHVFYCHIRGLIIIFNKFIKQSVQQWQKWRVEMQVEWEDRLQQGHWVHMAPEARCS